MPLVAGDILVRAIMQGSTLLPEDRYINDFAFRRAGGTIPSDAELDALSEAVDSFYNDTQTVGGAVGQYISEAVSRAVTHEMQFFSIATGGSPIYTKDWLGPVAPAIEDGNLPSEVAAVLSFHGNLTGIPEEVGIQRPKARRRGRIYVGPLTRGAVDLELPNPTLDVDFLTTLRQAALDMRDTAAGGAGGWTWSVWSRAASELYPVTGGWTDNAPDTQRRRGVSATARVVFSV